MEEKDIQEKNINRRKYVKKYINTNKMELRGRN